jgi:hypothetical protein
VSSRALRRAVQTMSMIGLATVGACAAPSGVSTQNATVTITETAPAVTVTLVVEVTGASSSVTVTAPPTAAVTAFRDGQHIIGRDIQPGTYRASSSGDLCYWERQDRNGDLLDNGFGTVATIRSSDFSFQSNRCGSWSRVG